MRGHPVGGTNYRSSYPALRFDCWSGMINLSWPALG
jgi:hypothetical protein